MTNDSEQSIPPDLGSIDPYYGVYRPVKKGSIDGHEEYIDCRNHLNSVTNSLQTPTFSLNRHQENVYRLPINSLQDPYDSLLTPMVQSLPIDPWGQQTIYGNFGGVYRLPKAGTL